MFDLRQNIKTDQQLFNLIHLECYTTMIKPIDKLVGYRYNLLNATRIDWFDSFGPIVKTLIQTQQKENKKHFLSKDLHRVHQTISFSPINQNSK